MSALAEALVAAQADLPCALGKDADGQIGPRLRGLYHLAERQVAVRPLPDHVRARQRRTRTRATNTWQRIIAAKGGPCRVCRDPASNGSLHSHVQFHHLVPRSAGGDDVADNIVPLCSDCHGLATLRNPLVLEVLARSLTDGEYAYIIGKMGEGALARLFGVGV